MCVQDRAVLTRKPAKPQGFPDTETHRELGGPWDSHRWGGRGERGKTVALAEKPQTLTEVDRRQPGQPRHGIGCFVLAPVTQQDVEDVVLGARAQSALVHTAAHQLTVLNGDIYGTTTCSIVPTSGTATLNTTLGTFMLITASGSTNNTRLRDNHT